MSWGSGHQTCLCRRPGYGYSAILLAVLTTVPQMSRKEAMPRDKRGTSQRRLKCTDDRYCSTLEERITGHNPSKQPGFSVGTIYKNFDSGDPTRVASPVWFIAPKSANLPDEERGLYLNFCPWCGFDFHPRLERFRADVEAPSSEIAEPEVRLTKDEQRLALTSLRRSVEIIARGQPNEVPPEDTAAEWLSAHPEAFLEFEGCIVAIHGTQGIVASGKDITTVMAEVKRLGLAGSVVYDQFGER